LVLGGHAHVLRCPGGKMRVRGCRRRLLHSYATNSCRKFHMLFGIWRVLKRLRLISGKATFFSSTNSIQTVYIR
jgi:hypothetical protein